MARAKSSPPGITSFGWFDPNNFSPKKHDFLLGKIFSKGYVEVQSTMLCHVYSKKTYGNTYTAEEQFVIVARSLWWKVISFGITINSEQNEGTWRHSVGISHWWFWILPKHCKSGIHEDEKRSPSGIHLGTPQLIGMIPSRQPIERLHGIPKALAISQLRVPKLW